jgi:very-short-patch-repair endonuclease
MNPSHISELVSRGALTIDPESNPLRPKFSKEEVFRLVEGKHYVVCKECGGWAGQISPKHLNACSSIDLKEYKKRHPGSPILCSIVSENRAKTENQKIRQSETLKARFQTPEGETTRIQIREAALRSMQSGYREVNAQRLRGMNRSVERREAVSRETKARWESGTQRNFVEGWHRDNRNLSLEGISKARKHISPEHIRNHLHKLHSMKTSRLHLGFKELLVRGGLSDFETESRIGPFDVDEACKTLRIALEINGCYWHGCEQCGFPGNPKTLVNDKRKSAYLKAIGWKVISIPEHLICKSPDEAVRVVLSTVAAMREVLDDRT